MSTSSIVPDLVGPGRQLLPKSGVELYKSADPVQKKFEKTLLEFIVLDGMPFDVTQGEGFRQMIWNLDKKLRVPCPKTMMTYLDKQYDLVRASYLYYIKTGG